ncbi:MAG: hypothetical protein PHX21_12895 [bacterium]|nr:hypothetical protein [bacterium]
MKAKTEVWLNIRTKPVIPLKPVEGWVAQWFLNYNGQGTRQFMEAGGNVGGKSYVKVTSQASPNLKVRKTPSLTGTPTGTVLLPGDTVELLNTKIIMGDVPDKTPVVNPPAVDPTNTVPITTENAKPPFPLIKVLSIIGLSVGAGLLIWAVWPKKKNTKTISGKGKGKQVRESVSREDKNHSIWEVMLEGEGTNHYQASPNKDDAINEISATFDIDFENQRFSMKKVRFADLTEAEKEDLRVVLD